MQLRWLLFQVDSLAVWWDDDLVGEGPITHLVRICSQFCRLLFIPLSNLSAQVIGEALGLQLLAFWNN